jgi:DNA-binding transcriptional regulator WhiA
MNKQDEKNLEIFFGGLLSSHQNETKKVLNSNGDIPNTLTLLLKVNGDYDVSGGFLSDDEDENVVHKKMIKSMLSKFVDCEILGECETKFKNNTLHIILTNNLTNEVTEHIIPYDKPLGVSDSHQLMGQPICHN